MKSHRPRNDNCHVRQGFILITVLVMLTFVILATAGIARRSLRMALHARRVEQDLQQTWLRHSLRTSVLPRAGRLLANQDANLATRPETQQVRWTLRLSLNDEPFTLILADEQTKLNVNMFRELTNASRTRSALQEASFGTDLTIRLRAFDTKDDVQSWGPVFDLSASSRPAWALAAATTDLTCWGSGALTVRHASDRSLKTLVSAAVGADVADRVIKLNRSDNAADEISLERRLALRRQQRDRLRQVITADSRCYSLWLLPENSPAQGEFHVLDRTRRRGDVHSFIW